MSQLFDEFGNLPTVPERPEPPSIFDRVSAPDIQPRNALVTIRRLGAAGSDRVGAILLPSQSARFDVAEIINVGPGSPDIEDPRADVHDLHPGTLILVRTESQPQPGMRARVTQKFTIDGEDIEFVNQTDIVATINLKQEIN